jgi:hypothetical protein
MSVITSQPKEIVPNEQPVKKPHCCCNENNELTHYAKYSLFPIWSIWALITTVACCPLLLCTAGGACGRSSSGHPTYPQCLAELQCCTLMCCKCDVGH